VRIAQSAWRMAFGVSRMARSAWRMAYEGVPRRSSLERSALSALRFASAARCHLFSRPPVFYQLPAASASCSCLSCLRESIFRDDDTSSLVLSVPSEPLRADAQSPPRSIRNTTASGLPATTHGRKTNSSTKAGISSGRPITSRGRMSVRSPASLRPSDRRNRPIFFRPAPATALIPFLLAKALRSFLHVVRFRA
jgi:hypothetical protein